MFYNPNHYRAWKLVERSMGRPTDKTFILLLKRYDTSLRRSGDIMSMLYYITLHGEKRHVEKAIPQLMPQRATCIGQRREITMFLKELKVALWYIPSLAAEKVSFAHRYFHEGNFSAMAA